jgi:hypothetical protein
MAPKPFEAPAISEETSLVEGTLVSVIDPGNPE